MKYLSSLPPDAHYSNTVLLLHVYVINWKGAAFANPTVDVLSLNKSFDTPLVIPVQPLSCGGCNKQTNKPPL